MSTWVTSDCHYGHKKLAFFRGFKTIEEMDEKLIENHNAVVQPQHTVYFLGDFSFYKEDMIAKTIERLNGRKYLIFGNHDYVIKKSHELQKLFVKCLDYCELKHEGQKLCLSHYPMMAWNRHHYGSIMLHGHCHGSMQYPFTGRIMDVGVDVHALKLLNLNDVVSKMSSITPHIIDNHVTRKIDGIETEA